MRRSGRGGHSRPMTREGGAPLARLRVGGVVPCSAICRARSVWPFPPGLPFAAPLRFCRIPRGAHMSDFKGPGGLFPSPRPPGARPSLRHGAPCRHGTRSAPSAADRSRNLLALPLRKPLRRPVPPGVQRCRQSPEAPPRRFTFSLSCQLARVGDLPFLAFTKIPRKYDTTMFDGDVTGKGDTILGESRDLITECGPTLECYECGHEGAHAMYSGTTTVVDEDGASTLPCDDGTFERRWTESECPHCGHCTRVRR